MARHNGAHQFQGREVLVGSEVRRYCKLCEQTVFIRKATDVDKRNLR